MVHASEQPPDGGAAEREPPPASHSAPSPDAPPAAGSSGSAAFDTLFCTHLQKLYRRAAMLTGSRQTAEDAVHEVYLKLAARPQRFLAHPEPYAYAFAALVSVVRDSWRRERRQVPVPEVEPVAGTAGAAWDGGVAGRAAELEALRLLRKLSVRQAGVVVLVDLDGYTLDQAAGILGVHRGTVARTRTRALRKLRGVLDPSAAGCGTSTDAESS
ncbi:RNA polymerase sigma factor [Streptomyces sp. JJ36]|uniref:RNA polymerase sigma factor n=1 Tax=Streptomyces sp. JJ36 TaxID=2736645 RepID=UPI001F29D6F0|nr:RNA polymerase sigma factor [Streptomyces sp. JJ36]